MTSLPLLTSNMMMNTGDRHETAAPDRRSKPRLCGLRCVCWRKVHERILQHVIQTFIRGMLGCQNTWSSIRECLYMHAYSMGSIQSKWSYYYYPAMYEAFFPPFLRPSLLSYPMIRLVRALNKPHGVYWKDDYCTLEWNDCQGNTRHIVCILDEGKL